MLFSHREVIVKVLVLGVLVFFLSACAHQVNTDRSIASPNNEEKEVRKVGDFNNAFPENFERGPVRNL